MAGTQNGDYSAEGSLSPALISWPATVLTAPMMPCMNYKHNLQCVQTLNWNQDADGTADHSLMKIFISYQLNAVDSIIMNR